MAVVSRVGHVDCSRVACTVNASKLFRTLSRRGISAHVLRRDVLLLGTLGGGADSRTILNSVLSGYGLPTLSNTKGFKAYDNFSSDYEFLYPRSWVLRYA
jgi:hypothetical protein